MRILSKVIETSLGSILASFVLIGVAVIGVNDFYYFKNYVMFGFQRKFEYPIMLTMHYKMFMFGDFPDEMGSYDWID